MNDQINESILEDPLGNRACRSKVQEEASV